MGNMTNPTPPLTDERHSQPQHPLLDVTFVFIFD